MPETSELIITLKLPNDLNQAMRYLLQALNDRIPNHTDFMNFRSHLSDHTFPITCMVWNVQGAGNREFLAVLREVIKVNKPIVLALVEIHMGSDHAKKVASMLGYSGQTRVDAQGFSGGIWVYWKMEVVTVDVTMQHN